MAETQAVDKDDSTETNETDAAPEQTDAEAETTDLSTERGGFKCIAELSVLKDYVATFSTIVDEMRLHINQDGFYAAAVDPANVAMVEDELSESAFEHYSSTGGLIGLNIGRMEDILSLGSAGDLVDLELDQETRKLHVQIDGLEYTLALIDPSTIRSEPEIPSLDLSSEVVLEGSKLGRGLKAADMVSDHIRFRIDEDSGDSVFMIEAEGDTDDVDFTLDGDDLIDLTPGDGDSLFSLDYLKDFNKAIPGDAELRIELGNEFPVKLNYEHIQVDDDRHGDVTMMLAPRIQSD